MATILEERVDVVEARVDRLEVIFGQFMVQTGMAIQRMDRTIERLDHTVASLDRTVERIEATIVEMKAEAAHDREEAARSREEFAREAAHDREEAARSREEFAREAAHDREEAARSREEFAREAARDREEAARSREEFAQASVKDRADFEQYREEAARERREMNKRWGELARKQGTLVEDLIAPSLRRIARDELGCGDVRFFAERVLRIRSDDPSRRREFDALYVGEFAVLLNETKSSPRAEDAQAFLDFLRSGEFARYFPEYRDLPIVPVFSSLYLPADLVTFLSRNRIYAVAMGEEAMQVLNRDQVQQAAA